MRVNVTLKSLGSRRSMLRAAPLELRHCPQTVEELIREAVHACVAAYNARFARKQASPLSEAEMEHMSQLGKIAFGLNYGVREADEQTALATALQAYEDGLVRIFHGETECGGLAGPLCLREGDCLTFIRLTMLTGIC